MDLLSGVSIQYISNFIKSQSDEESWGKFERDSAGVTWIQENVRKWAQSVAGLLNFLDPDAVSSELFPPEEWNYGTFFAGSVNDHCILPTSDVDAMYVYEGMAVGNSGEHFGLIDCTDIHPGYLKVIVDDPFRCDIPSPANLLCKDPSGLTFLSSAAVSNVFLTNMSSGRVDKASHRSNLTTHGPAVIEEVGLHPYFSSGLTVDHVLALPCPIWPQEAKEWITRKRTQGWPSEKIVHRVASAGCHVVPIAHRTSTNKDIEWRFSFSVAEGIIMKSFSRQQKLCYAVLKCLHKTQFTHPDVLSSYHFKNAYLNVCEKINPDVLEHHSAIGVLVLATLDEILHYLLKRNFPNYWIPSNNMISDVSKDSVTTLLKQISTIRKSPRTIDLSELDNVETPLFEIPQSVGGKFESLVESHPEIYGYPAFPSVCAGMLLRSLWIIEQKQSEIALLCLKWTTFKIAEGPECIRYLNAFIQVASLSFEEKILYCEHLSNLHSDINDEDKIQYRQHILNAMSDVPADMLTCGFQADANPVDCAGMLLGTLAHEYHVQAFHISEQDKELLRYAEDRFEQALEMPGSKQAIQVNFGFLLVQKEKFRKAASVVNEILNASSGWLLDWNTYTSRQACVLDEPLKNEANYKVISLPSIVFGYYISIKCKLKVDETFKRSIEHQNALFEPFEHICKNVVKDYDHVNPILFFYHMLDRSSELMSARAQAYSLLGYCYMMCARYAEASLSFQKAIDLQPDYSLAMQNYVICRRKSVHGE